MGRGFESLRRLQQSRCSSYWLVRGRWSGWDLALHGQEQCDARRVDEVGFVCRRGLPFGGGLSCAEGIQIVEPELGHAVEVYALARLGYQRMRLNQAAETRNLAANRSVDVVPVGRKLREAEIG